MLLTLPFLLVVGVLLPLMAWSSHRWLVRAEPGSVSLPSMRALAIQTLVVQALVFGLAALAAWGGGLTVPWRSRFTWSTGLTAIGVVAAGLGVAWIESRRPLGRGDQLRRLMRRAGVRDPVWLAATVSAAVTEEFAYRGVLTQWLASSLGLWLSSAVSAAMFGLGHFGQGWRGAFFSSVFGLALQGVVFGSGGLALAVLAHLSYDLAVAALGRRIAAREPEVRADR